LSVSQLQIDFQQLDRAAWIDNAAIPVGVSHDGTKVMPDKLKAVLHKINNRMGKNAEAWPSQKRIADEIGCSEPTVVRAIQALQDLSLLIVQLKNLPGKRTVVNHYRIVWSELLLLDSNRRRAFLATVSHDQSIVAHDQSIVAHDQSIVAHDQSIVAHDQSIVTIDELLTNCSTNKPKNPPPPFRAVTPPRSPRPRAGNVPPEWAVVVSVLASLGMSACVGAVTAAIGRELTPTDVLGYVERLERLRARNPHATVGWLYRWITGASEPPPETAIEEKPEQVTKPHGGYFAKSESRRLEAERLRSRIVKEGRRLGVSEDAMREKLSVTLEANGFERDLVTL
jgi:biotin operon repressor